MRMREIINILEQTEPTDRDLFHTTHCDALAVKVHQIHHIPLVAIVDKQSGRYVRVCNRVADNYFITVDGTIDRDDLLADCGLDSADTRHEFRPISQDALETYLREKGVRPKTSEIMDRAEQVAQRLTP